MARYAQTVAQICLLILALSGCGKSTVDPKKRELLIKRAEIDMNSFLFACDQYKIDHGRYPATVDEIYTLEQRGKGTTAYLARRSERDPWETAYRIVTTSNRVSIASAGPDTKWGTVDDLYQDKPSADFLKVMERP